ncbi:MAG: hypothetical protein K2X93_11485 [Candidatus Obscuribacterales bacterium]|nr:hypothetical protein [Candidatus Obscuribacterales bacterium]
MSNSESTRDSEALDSSGSELERVNYESAGQRLINFVLAERASSGESKPDSEPTSEPSSAPESGKVAWSVGSEYPEIFVPGDDKATATGCSELLIGRCRISDRVSEYAIGLAGGSEPLVRLRYDTTGGKETLALSVGLCEQPYLFIEREVDESRGGNFQIRYAQPDGGLLNEQRIEIAGGALTRFDGSYSVPGYDGSSVLWNVSCALNSGSASGGPRVRDIQYRRSDREEAGFTAASGLLRNMLSEAIYQSIRTVEPRISRADLFYPEQDDVESSISPWSETASAWEELLGRVRAGSDEVTASPDRDVDIISPAAQDVRDESGTTNGVAIDGELSLSDAGSDSVVAAQGNDDAGPWHADTADGIDAVPTFFVTHLDDFGTGQQDSGRRPNSEKVTREAGQSPTVAAAVDQSARDVAPAANRSVYELLTVGALSSIEALIVAEELGRADSTAPSAKRCSELMVQLRHMLGSEQQRAEARRLLFGLVEASATEAHRAYVDERFAPEPHTSNLPVNLSHLSPSERERISSVAISLIEGHLSSHTVEPLTGRESTILALLGSTSSNADIRLRSSQLLAADVRSPHSRGSALEAIFNCMQVPGANRDRLGMLYLSNMETLPSDHFSTFQCWAACGDAISLQIMARVMSGANPREMMERAQSTLLEYASTPEQQEQVVKVLLARQARSRECGMVVQTIGLLASRGSNDNPSEIQQEALRVMRESLRLGFSPNSKANPTRDAVLDAYFANARYWSSDDATLAASITDTESLERNAEHLNLLRGDAGRRFLASLRHNAEENGGLPAQDCYIRAVRALPWSARTQDVDVLARILEGARRNNEAWPGRRRLLIESVESSLLACIDASGREVQNKAFDRFWSDGFVEPSRLDEKALEILRRYSRISGAAAGSESMERLLASSYATGDGVPPSLPVVLTRLGVTPEALRSLSAVGGATEEVVDALIGFKLLAMMPSMPPDLRHRVIDSRPLIALASERDAVRRLVEHIPGAVSADELAALRNVPARLTAERETLRRSVEELSRQIERMAEARDRRRGEIFESISAEDRAQATERMRANEPLVGPRLNGLDAPAQSVPTNRELLERQREAIDEWGTLERNLRELRDRHAVLLNDLNTVSGLLLVAEHQTLLRSGELRRADVAAMRGLTRNDALTRGYFTDQLQRGTGAPRGSSSALSRLRDAGIIPPALVLNPTAPDHAVDLFRSALRPVSADEQSMASELRHFALESILRSSDGQKLRAFMNAIEPLDFAGLVQVADRGRRTTELDRLIRDNEEHVRGALTRLDRESTERLTTALTDLASTGDPEAKKISEKLLAVLRAIPDLRRRLNVPNR